MEDSLYGGPSTDRPVADPAQDRFHRSSFAHQLAQTLTSRNDPSSLIVGIYGRWGEGKTSVLNFLRKDLKGLGASVVDFNPWLFGDEQALLRGFFLELGDSIGRELSTKLQKAGRLLQKYGGVLSGKLNPVFDLKELGSAISDESIAELRRRLEHLLSEAQVPIVVLVDDIDRLDKTEIHQLFRIIKLCGDIDWISYVLAFDDQMVAEALGERYASSGTRGGQEFLEKIVHVPLRLPAPHPGAINALASEVIDQTLAAHQIALTQEDIARFYLAYSTGIEPTISTPRLAKRYGNIIGFSLPLLKDEVDVVDLLLVEGLRLLYPAVYEVVRSDPEMFVRSSSDESKKRALQEHLNGALKLLDPKAKKAAEELLRQLFPACSYLFTDLGFAGDPLPEWDRERRIASPEFFGRFFSFSVLEGQVPDVKLRAFVQGLAEATLETLTDQIQNEFSQQERENLPALLRGELDGIGPSAAKNLARALAGCGDVFPNPPRFLMGTPFIQAAMLVAELLGQVEPEDRRLATAQNLLAQDAKPTRYAAEIFKWLRHVGGEADHRFSAEQRGALGSTLGQRIKSSFETGEVSLASARKDAAILLLFWSETLGPESPREFLDSELDETPAVALELIRGLTGTQWGSEGIPRDTDFERSGYDALATVASPTEVKKALQRQFGELEIPERYPHRWGSDDDEEIVYAKQFLWLHHKAMSGDNLD